MTDEQIAIKSLASVEEVKAHRDDIWVVLEKTNNEYFPPLSSREVGGVDDPPIARTALWTQPVDYFDEILKEHVILAYINGKPVGMISYIPRFSGTKVTALADCTYIDTVGVIPGWRRRGIARHMYQVLFQADTVRALDQVALRTWSTNESHINLIVSLGFKEIERHIDERAPGVDTIYFTRDSKPSPFE